MDADGLDAVRQYLRDVVHRMGPDTQSTNRIAAMLKEAKQTSVTRGDQSRAKALWCLEKVLLVQNHYLSAYQSMKSGDFYVAWCALERVEIELSFLNRHYHADAGDAYKLCYIEKHTQQFQSLYPYKLFVSPAILAVEKVCTICRRPVSLRNPCGHKVGEIYDGEMCGREITRLEMAEISVVTKPSQKYSVLFVTDEKSGQSVDRYNYNLVRYVIRGLSAPFDAWDLNWTKAYHPHSRYEHVGPDEKCPCGSGNTYRRCCLRRPGVIRPHVDVIFSVKPPDDLPTFEFSD